MAYTFQMLGYSHKVAKHCHFYCGLWACAGQLCVSDELTIQTATIDLNVQTTATHMPRLENLPTNQTYMCSVK